MDYNSHSSSRGGGPAEGYPSPADRRPTASSSSHSSSQAYSHPTLSTQTSYSSNNPPPNDPSYQSSPYGSSYRNQPKLSIRPSSPESGPHSAPPQSSSSNLPPSVSVPPRSATSPSPSSRLSNPPPPSSSNRQGEGEGSRWNSRPPSEEAQDDDHGLAYLGRERRTSYADGASSGSESQYSGSARGAQGGEDGRGMSSSSRARQAGAGPSSSSIDPSYSSHSHSYGLPLPASRSGTPSSTYDGPRPPSTAPSSPPSAHSHAVYPSPPQPHYHPPQPPHSSNSLQSPTQQQSNPYNLGPLNSSSALSHTSSAYAPSGSASSHQSQSHQSTQAVWPGNQPQQPQPQTICASCGHPVTGPFVRALKTVYHLDCFRCQVRSLVSRRRKEERSSRRRSSSVFVLFRSPPFPSPFLQPSFSQTGLQQGRRCQVLPYREQGREAVPFVRDGLLQEVGPHLQLVRDGSSRELYYGLSFVPLPLPILRIS